MRVPKAGTAALGARVIAAGLQALLVITLARQLNVSSFGAFAATAALATILITLLGGGCTPYLLRLGQAENGQQFSAAVTLSTAAAFAGIIVAGASFSFLHPTLEAAVALGAISALADAVNLVAQNSLFAKQEWVRGQSQLLYARIFPIGAAWIAMAAGASETELIQATGAGYATTAAVALVRLKPRRSTMSSFRETLKHANAYWRTSILALTQQVDVPLISVFVSVAASGIYSGAFRLAGFTHLITATIISYAVPRLSAIKSRPQRIREGSRYQHIAYIYAGLLLIGAWPAAIVGPVVLGPSFRETGIFFAIFIANAAASVISQVTSARFYAEDKAALVAQANLITTLAALTGLAIGLWLSSIFLIALLLFTSQSFLALCLVRKWKRYAADTGKAMD